jgi:hypothetical protein
MGEMRTIVCTLSIGYPGATREDVLTIPDTYSDDEIEDAVSDWAHNYIEWNWKIETDEDKQS